MKIFNQNFKSFGPWNERPSICIVLIVENYLYALLLFNYYFGQSLNGVRYYTRCTCVNTVNDHYSLNMRPGKITLYEPDGKSPHINRFSISMSVFNYCYFPPYTADSPRQRSCNCFGYGGSSPRGVVGSTLKKNIKQKTIRTV